MTHDNPMTPPGDAATVRRFLDALARRDFDELEALLAPDVWFRALLPRSIHETRSAGEAIAALRDWYGGASEFEPLTADRYRMANREHLRYRFRLLPAWAPEEWHEIEQAGFCRVRDGRISRLDVVCSGFHATGEIAASPPEAVAAAV